MSGWLSPSSTGRAASSAFSGAGVRSKISTRPVIDVVAPQLRPGAMIVCDNVQMYEKEYADYTAFVRNPKNGFRSVLLSHEGGLEISIKLD